MSRRLFIGVPIADNVRSAIQLQLKDIPGRIVPAQNWHFTLHFLGEIEEERIARLDQGLREVELGNCFKGSITHFNAFPNSRSARILWLGISLGIAEFTLLAESVAGALKAGDFALEERSFIPHLTLSRLPKPNNLRRFMEETPFKKIPFRVEKIVVYESLANAHSYKQLFQYDLKNTKPFEVE